MKKMNKKMTLEKLGDTVNNLASSMKEGFIKADENLEKLAGIVKNSFDHIEGRLNGVDERFNKIDKRFDGLEATIDHKFNEVNSRLTSVESRVGKVEVGLGRIEDTLEPVGIHN